MSWPTFRVTLAYGALAALVLVCLRLASLAPLALDWGRELVGAAIAVVAIVVGVALATRRAAPAAARDAAAARIGDVSSTGGDVNGVEDPATTDVPVPIATPGADGEPLSRREHDVLVLLAEGLSNKELARRLGVSANTVKTHLANVYAKLGARRRTEAIAAARRRGLIA